MKKRKLAHEVSFPIIILSLIASQLLPSCRRESEDSDQSKLQAPIPIEEEVTTPSQPAEVQTDALQVAEPEPSIQQTPPFIQLTVPEWISRYSEHVIVRGRVWDSAQEFESRPIAEMASLRWEILDTNHRAEIKYDQEGFFAFAIPTLGLPPVFYLRIVSVNRQGHTAEKIVALIAKSTASQAGMTVPEVEEGVKVTALAPRESAAPSVAEVVEEHRIEAPVLILTDPRENDYFSRKLTIRGEVQDPDGDLREFPGIASLRWEVEESALGGELEIDESGKFSAVVDTSVVRRDALLIVRAVGSNGEKVERSVRLRADTVAPILQIFSPQEGGIYDETVIVRGQVRDSLASNLTWKVIGESNLSGTAVLGDSGSFEFDFSLKGLNGTQILELRAEDAAANITVSTVTLRERSSGRAPAAAEAEPATAAAVESAPAAAVESAPAAAVESAPAAAVEPATAAAAEPVVVEAPEPARAEPATIPKSTEPVPSTVREGALTPELLIEAPVRRAYYRSELRVAGSLHHGDSLSWEIAGSGLGDTLMMEKEGTFSFQIPTAGLHGTQVLRLVGHGTVGSTEEMTILLLDGNINPSMVISSPIVDQLYGAEVRVSGTIIDPYADSDTMGGIESVTYDVTSPDVFSMVKEVPRGKVQLRADNSFDFTINTRELAGPQDVNIVVRARSGNQTKTSVRIQKGEADIPSFSVEPGDRRVTLRWDSLPSATRYTLNYRTANPGQGEPRESRLEMASSPYILTGLSNGNRYVFQIEAVLPGEADGLSAEKWAIPLSGETLRPTTVGEYRQIRVFWPSIPGCERYELWRSTEPDGEYSTIAEALLETSYVDREVQYGRSYFYKVAPASLPLISSNPAAGESTAFPLKKLESRGIYRMNQARGITLLGGYAFVADGGEGIKIIDISSPEKLTVVGSFQTAQAHGVAVQGEYAFVADGQRGLRVLDISDPRYPEEIGMRKTMDARAIAVRGDIAFVADGSSGLKIIDVSSPVQPARIGSYTTENACDLVIQDQRLYLADGTGGLRIFEISGSSDLVEIGGLSGVDARALAIQGSTLYLAAGQRGLIIVDLTRPREPVELGRYASGEALSVDANGSFAYLVDSQEGMVVVDVSDPARPWHFASFPANSPISVVVRDHYAYLTTAQGLQVVHILIQGRSVPVATCPTGGKAFALAIAGPRAYVACHDRGIRIIDISDPAGLNEGSLLGSWSNGYAAGIGVAETTAFVASARRGLIVLDLQPAFDDSTLTQPEEIGSYYTGGTARRAEVRSDLLFVADGGEGLKILDISNPSSPLDVGSLPTEDARDVALLPGYTLVADAESGLIVCDIADPRDPQLIATLGNEGVQRVVLQETLVVTAGSSGIEIFDFSDPRDPRSISRYQSSYVEGLCFDDSYLYLAEGHRGLTVLDLRSPEHPIVVSACPEIYAVDVAVQGGHALVVDSEQIQVVEILIPEWLRQSPSLR